MSERAAAALRLRMATMYYLLFYDYVDDMVNRRTPVRAEHLAHATAHVERGQLKMAGAYSDEVDGAVFVWTVDNRAVIERFVADDPYVQHGLVPSYRIRPWNVVVGG
jgi:uncharacterized protein YciI